MLVPEGGVRRLAKLRCSRVRELLPRMLTVWQREVAKARWAVMARREWVCAAPGCVRWCRWPGRFLACGASASTNGPKTNATLRGLLAPHHERAGQEYDAHPHPQDHAVAGYAVSRRWRRRLARESGWLS